MVVEMLLVMLSKIDDSKLCKHSKLVRENVLENIFVELYNLIIENTSSLPFGGEHPNY